MNFSDSMQFDARQLKQAAKNIQSFVQGKPILCLWLKPTDMRKNYFTSISFPISDLPVSPAASIAK